MNQIRPYVCQESAEIDLAGVTSSNNSPAPLYIHQSAVSYLGQLYTRVFEGLGVPDTSTPKSSALIPYCKLTFSEVLQCWVTVQSRWVVSPLSGADWVNRWFILFQPICIGPRNGCQDGREEVQTSAVVTLTQASTLALGGAETQRSWNKSDRWGGGHGGDRWAQGNKVYSKTKQQENALIQ